MTKNLYLLRHGEAGQSMNIKDFERTLTERGADELRSLGIEMKQKGFLPELVYCSTSVRTRQTAGIFLEQVGYNGPVTYLEEIYEAPVNTLFNIVTNTEAKFRVILLIGHNPGISYLLDYLSTNRRGNLAPGELVNIAFEDVRWSEVTKGLGTKIPV